MKKITLSQAAAATIAVAALSLIGCKGNNNGDSMANTSPNLDSINQQIVERTMESNAPAKMPGAGIERHESVILSTVYDLAVIDSIAYSVTDGGLMVNDLVTGERGQIRSDDPLFAVVRHGDALIAGGNRLYRVEDTFLVPIETQFDGAITVLCSYGPLLMIGTESGLYSHTVLGDIQLMGDVWVTALEPDRDGLWVGTDGDGLYRWDGSRFAKRYLKRDTCVFDFVNCIEYSRDRLYVGTSSGLHIFDGGKWQTLTSDNGLPSNTVTAVDASGWIAYVGTDEGLVTWFNDALKPVGKLEAVSVTAVRTSPYGVLVATEGDGLYQKAGAAVKMLFGPDAGESPATLSMVF